MRRSSGRAMPADDEPRLLHLKARDRVVLTVDAFPALAATVAATTPTAATLLLDAAAVPARMLHKKQGSLETQVEGRTYRGSGQVHMVARRGRVRDDAVVFRFGTAAPPMRRVHQRTPAVLPVTLVPMTSDLPPAHGLTVDLSANGALVRGPDRLTTGDELLLHLLLPDEELPLPAKGEVVRRAGDGLLGVRLDTMRPADRELVVRWVMRTSAQRRGEA